jgi:nucleoside-diphosphate-sugar epimerase
MKVLFIGGTGTISSAITRQFCDRMSREPGHELYLLNRGSRGGEFPRAAQEIRGDIKDEADIAAKIKGLDFDVVADFITFTPADAERDYRLFRDKTKQYLCFSSASAYQKPPQNHLINESTPLANPYWQYSRDKIAVEDFLARKYREEGFPFTVIRPSHTYDERKIPLGVHGSRGSWQVAKRILEGKPAIIHGDGTSLWTLTHNSDFARGFIGLMGNIHAIGETVGITSDETLTWNQIYAAIAAALNRPLKAAHVSSEFLAAVSDYDLRGSLLGDKANSVVFDNSKLKRLVPGFTATVRFDQGIRETVAYILAHGELQIEDPEFDLWCDRVVAAQEKAMREVRGE